MSGRAGARPSVDSGENVERGLSEAVAGLVEPLVFGVHAGDGDDGDFEGADGAVAAAGEDEAGIPGREGQAVVVELHVAFALEHVVDFRELPVVVGL